MPAAKARPLSTCSWPTLKSSQHRLGHRWPSFLGYLMKPSIPDGFARICCTAPSSASSLLSKAGFPLKNHPKGWSSCAWTRKPSAVRASFRRCFHGLPNLLIESPRRSSFRRRWRNSLALRPTVPLSMSCSPAWTVHLWTMERMTTHWNPQPLTMNW